MKNKTVMVTGANSGIGKVTTREIAKMGATVVMVCRNMEKGQAVCDDINAEIGLERVHLLQADFAVHSSIKAMSETFKQKFDRLDVLVNNAGGIKSTKKMTPDGFEWMFGVNHLGYFLTTHYLLESIQTGESGRVVNVSSLAHRFANLDWNNLNAEKGFQSFTTYGLSKLCNILFTKKLASFVQKDGITSNALHPGGVATNFGKGGTGILSFIYETIGSRFMLTPEEGAATSIYLASSPDVNGISGEYFVKKKKVFPSTLAMSSQNAEKLWDISMQLTGIQTFGKP